MARTLLIVDDHRAFRDFARTVLSRDGFDVAGEAEDGESALGAVPTLRPDVVLVDVQLPGIDGIAVAEQLAALEAPPDVVLMSGRTASDYGSRLSGSPARGFIPKQDFSPEAIAALLAAG